MAPLALVVVVIALLAVVSGSGGGDGKSSASQTPPSGKKQASARTRTGRHRGAATGTTGAAGAKSYTVQIGDTLGAIAGKTGVPLSTIQDLNPNVDPHALTAGQKIRLR